MKRRLGTTTTVVIVAAAFLAAGLLYALQTSPTATYVPADNEGPPLYRYLTLDSKLNQNYIRICADPFTQTTDNQGETINWGNVCSHQGFRINPWNPIQDYVWLENSRSDNTSLPEYSRNLLITTSDWTVERGRCEIDTGDASDYTPGDDRWHPSVSHAYKRINVYRKTDGTWHLQWFNVLTCQETKPIPLTGTGGVTNWEVVHGIGNFEGRPDTSGRYVALNGIDTTPDPDEFRMVVLDMGVTDTDAYQVSNDVNLCDPSVWDFGVSCPSFTSSGGSTQISPDAKYVVVKHREVNNREHTRVYDFDPNAATQLAIRNLMAGSSDNDPNNANHWCPCDSDPGPGVTCLTGRRDEGFGPLGAHIDVGINPNDSPDEAVVVGQRRTACQGPTSFYDQQASVQFSAVMWKVRDGHLYGALLDPNINEAFARHVTTVGQPGWVYVSFDDNLDPNDSRPYEQEVAAIAMSSEGPGPDSVQRFTHHHSWTRSSDPNVPGGSADPNIHLDDEDEPQFVGRPVGGQGRCGGAGGRLIAGAAIRMR